MDRKSPGTANTQTGEVFYASQFYVSIPKRWEGRHHSFSFGQLDQPLNVCQNITPQNPMERGRSDTPPSDAPAPIPSHGFLGWRKQCAYQRPLQGLDLGAGHGHRLVCTSKEEEGALEHLYQMVSELEDHSVTKLFHLANNSSKTCRGFISPTISGNKHYSKDTSPCRSPGPRQVTRV